jgi:DNA-binding XRE family transcriptional regulator
MKKVTVNQLLEESPLTQREIAKKLGMSEQHFCSNIKNNYGSLKVNQFSLFAEMLETTMEDLYNIWEKERKNK